MTEQNDANLIIGEMRGQLREVVHSVNNLSAKFDSLSREVMSLAAMAGAIGKIEAKVEVLERDRNQRAGANGFALTLMKSPALGWLVGAVITVWAVVTGKVHV